MSSLKNPQIDLVRIQESVLYKIIKHSNYYERDQYDKKDDDSEYIGGKLMGYYNEEASEIEIGTSYPMPLPSKSNYEPLEYLQEMNKRQSQVYVDNLDCGWYQVSYRKNNLVNFETFEAQKEIQSVNPFGVYLVYDYLQARNGNKLPFKAYKLSQQFIDMSKQEFIDYEKLKEYSSQYDVIFKEIPVEIQRSPLTQVFLNSFGDKLKESFVNNKVNHPQFDYGQEFVKNTEVLAESISDVQNQNGLNIEERKEQKKLVEQNKQLTLQTSTKKYIDFRFINDRVKEVATLINHQAELNKNSQIVLQKLQQN